MRYGVVSDVHGNLLALRATVAMLRAAGVDGWLCAGDIVGYGPEPEGCVELLHKLAATCVAGNRSRCWAGFRRKGSGTSLGPPCGGPAACSARTP